MNTISKLATDRGRKFALIFLVSLVCFVSPSFSYAPENGLIQPDDISVSGHVSDREGNPLIGVTVREKEGTNNAVTNENGDYVINVADDAVLIFSYVGFEDKEVAVDGKSVLDVVLDPSLEALDELVVVGYGTEKRSDVTGSVVSVKAEDIQGIPTRSIGEMLRGRASGVEINTNSSRPGGTSDILIRGQRSLTGGNSPLFVVDGVPVDANTANDINAADIESIEILKDASSQAIYGARASNGVVLITTKRGLASGPVKVNYSGYVGVQQLKKNFDLYDAQEWAQLTREAFRTDAGSYVSDENIFDQDQLNMLKSGEEINWQKFMLRDAMLQKHDLSLRGGNENTKAAFSLGYLNQEGMVENSGFERGTIRLNVDQKVSDKIGIGANIMYARNFQTLEDGNLSEYIIMPPLAMPYDENGDLQLWVDFVQDRPNPKFLNRQTTHERRNERTLVNFFGTVDLFDGLKYKLNMNLNSRNQEESQYRNNLYQKGSVIGSKASISASKDVNYLIENILTYDKEINAANKFDVTLVQSFYREKNNSIGVSGSKLPNDILEYNGISSSGLIDIPTRSITERTLLSYLGRIRYTLMDKFLFTATTRVDGSSVFGPENKYGVFPSASIAWKMEEEEFIKNIHWIDQLKPRINYGQVGNQAINPYTTLGEATSYPMLFGDGSYEIGYLPSNTLSNPKLKWETTKSINFGVDFDLFKGRISGSMEYYKSNTTDLLVLKSLPESIGYTGMLTNIGEVENKGFEFNLNTVPVQNDDLKWNVYATFSTNKNRLLVLDGTVDEEGRPVDDKNNRWFIGEEIGPYYNYIFDGIWQEGDDIAHSAQPQAQPGDVRVKDLDENGVIDDEDRGIIRRMPKWYGTVGSGLNYKSFDLLVDFYTVQGIVRSNSYLYEFNDGGSLTGKTNGVKVNYWTPENPSTEYPRPRQNSNIQYFSSAAYQDASYLRLRTITLGYTLPYHITSKAGMSNVRFYISGNNVWTKTKYMSYNPEASPGSYPEPKMFMFGVNISL